MQKLGLFLFVLSFLPWLVILFVVPFLPLDITQKTTLSVVLAVGAEVCFWISVVLLGKEVVTKYRRYLHPRYLWKKIRNFNRRWTGIDADNEPGCWRLSAVKVELFAENLQANRAFSVSEIHFYLFSRQSVQASQKQPQIGCACSCIHVQSICQTA